MMTFYGPCVGAAGDGKWRCMHQGGDAFVGAVMDTEQDAKAQAERLAGGRRSVRTVFTVNTLTDIRLGGAVPPEVDDAGAEGEGEGGEE